MADGGGLWVNYETGESFAVHEHEQWLRAGDNAERLGLSKEEVARIQQSVPVRDRSAILLYVLERAPVAMD